MAHEVREKRCPQCDAAFTCGPDHESGRCWCDALPPILPPTPGLECLCRNCLVKALRPKISEYVAAMPAEQRAAGAAKRHARPDTPLIEGIDFYRENGYMVFTEWHHLKRGSCCGNGCRHCPYEKPGRRPR